MKVALILMSVLFSAPGYDSLERLAAEACPLNKRPTEQQQELIEALFEIEREEGVPGFARGILAAAACREAAYKLRVGCGDGGASCGLFQFSSDHWRRLRAMGAATKDPRQDWRVGARYWLRLVKKQLRIVRRDCKGLFVKKDGKWKWDPAGSYPSVEEYHWASANKTATWKYKCRKKGRCRKCKDGSKAKKGVCPEPVECEKWYCKSQAARCSIPPWRWRGHGKHRRQETRHWALKRDWHLRANTFRATRLARSQKAK